MYFGQIGQFVSFHKDKESLNFVKRQVFFQTFYFYDIRVFHDN